jgi:hypothetical protein
MKGLNILRDGECVDLRGYRSLGRRETQAEQKKARKDTAIHL